MYRSVLHDLLHSLAWITTAYGKLQKWVCHYLMNVFYSDTHKLSVFIIFSNKSKQKRGGITVDKTWMMRLVSLKTGLNSTRVCSE